MHEMRPLAFGRTDCAILRLILGLWPVAYGLWPKGLGTYGLWPMAYGLWFKGLQALQPMDYGSCGPWPVCPLVFHLGSVGLWPTRKAHLSAQMSD